MSITRINEPDSIAQFLPGLLSGLVKLLKKNVTGNHKLLVAIVNVISLSLNKALSDESCTEFIGSTLGDGIVKTHSAEERWLKRDKNWHIQTTTNIALVLPMVYLLKSNPNVNVRTAILDSCMLLLDNCCQSLLVCHQVLIDTLLYFISDQSESIANACKEKVWRIMSSKESSIWFQISLENSLSTLLANFKDLVRQADDKKKVESLLMINNHLIVMKESAVPILENQIDQVVSSFIWVLDPQVNNVKMVQETALSAFDTIGKNLGLGFPKQQFSRFDDQSVLGLVSRITKSLLDLDFCKQSLLDSLVDHLDVKADQYQSIILLNQVFKTTDQEVAESIVTKYLDLDFSALNDTQTLSFARKPPTVAESNAVIVKTSVMLEGLAMATAILSPIQVAHVMMDGLYLMLEKLGDPNYTVSSSAAACLETFAAYCERDGYASEVMSNSLVTTESTRQSSVSNLVLKHVDYLLDTCSKKLRYVTRYPMAPRVLVAAIRVTGPSIIGPLMTDCVDQVLDILDELGTSGYVPVGLGSNDIVDNLFEVLHSLINLMDAGSTADNLITDWEMNFGKLDCSQQMRDFINREKILVEEIESKSEKYKTAQEYFTRKDIPEETEARPTTEEEPAEPEKEQLIVLSQWETLSLKIIQRSMYFLSSDSPRLRSKVLEIIYLGIPLLSHQPNSLYPLIHQIWPLVLKRSLDTVHYVAVKSLLVIRACARHGKEFMRQRIQKDVINHLLLIFKQLQEPKKQTGGGNVVSKAHRTRKDVDLVNACLSTLESIIQWVPLGLSQKNELAIVLVRFLDARVYAAIIDQVLGLVRLLYQKHGDWVWALVKMVLEGDLSELGDGTGNPKDYYYPCFKLVDLFSGTRSSLITGERLIQD
jgi:TELO2-interacting protein 1